jgi:hypothetical protein
MFYLFTPSLNKWMLTLEMQVSVQIIPLEDTVEADDFPCSQQPATGPCPEPHASSP